MIKLLVFDLDGTLVDSRQDLCNSVNFALKQAAWPTLPLETVMGNVGNGARNLLEDCLSAAMDVALGTAKGKARPTAEAVDSLYSVFMTHYHQHCLVETLLYPGAESVLRSLKGYRKAVLTNKPEKPARIILDGLQVASHFELTVGGDTPYGKKPDPAGLRHILSALGASPDEAVMIGDGEQDAEAARNAGVRFIGFLSGIGSREVLLRTEPDAVIKDLAGLTQALSILEALAADETVSAVHESPA